ncbi:large proline-rich protein bag6 [Cydia amplana]|uniref:large proline-rich protein bag6 n=1 Tax=Cydia amplana TaxID=1869771 RepID=UPI002FE675EB
MIEFTIKTLDSTNHNFSVEDEITVQQLKEKVREQMGIEINLQRLIFCGRVLQDEKRLSDYDVKGKVVHLVQRAPPSPESRHSGYTVAGAGAAEGTNANANQTRRPSPLASIIREEQASTSPTSGRLDFIRLMVSEIKTSLASLQAQAPAQAQAQAQTANGETSTENASASGSGEGNVENMETDPAPSGAQEEGDSTLDEGGEAPPDSAARAQHARRRSYRAIRALRARHSRPRDLGQLMEELESLQEQFAPHRAQYTHLLMAANSAEPPIYTEEERQNAQRTVDIVSDIMHSFAHAYHAVSDINFQVGQRNPRLTSEASVMRHPLPMQQAHINVVQSNRRQPGQNGTVPTAGAGVGAANTATGQAAPATTATATSATSIANATVTSGSATATATSASAATPAPTAIVTGNPTDAQPTTDPNAAGRNSTQPTVNINIQPDPITYQVEIETRVPIAFALENALLNGLAGAHGQVPAGDAQPNQPQQPQDGQPNQTNQGNQPQQPRRRVLFDFENLFRGLGQNGGLGGVEVVMSMEEIPNGQIVGSVPAGPAAAEAGAGAGARAEPGLHGIGVQQGDGGGNTPHIFGADIYLGGMPWGGAPSADLLQNIVSSVIRQGLLPGGEAVALQVAHALPNAAPDQPQPQNGQTPGRHANLHLRRATTTTRAHAVTLNNFIYDRFLLCVSPHARRRLLRRREQQQHQAAAHARARADRAAAQNIEVLRERNPNFTQNHIQTMVDLLSSEPGRASFTNAFFVAVARHLFLTEPMQIVSGESALVPNEFQALRQMLRVYLQELLVRSGGVHSDHTFETVAGFLVTEQQDFLSRVETIVSLRSEFNFGASMRALIASRLPAIVASVMSNSATESFVARFYAMFSHLFTDMCTLMAYCCRDGVDGLRTLFRAFLEEKVRDWGSEDVQQVLITLGMENLGVVINSLNAITPVDPIQQFVIRRAPAAAAAAPQEPSPMDVSPPAPEACPAPPAPAAPAPTSASDVSSTTTEAGEARASRPLSSSEAAPATEPQPSRSTPSQSPRASRPERESAPQRTSPDSQSNNLNFVPPMMLLQHWGEEWVPVFTRDQHNMNAAQEPYSDAYLSGMPSRKRRCVRQSRPPHTLETFINGAYTTTDVATALGRRLGAGVHSRPAQHERGPGAHWGEDWVPVFTRDQHNMNAAQEPYSDAYLSGMPSRKRRCVRQSRPPHTLETFINGAYTTTDVATALGRGPHTRSRHSSTVRTRPLMLLQHWGEDWVPVFTRDQHNMNAAQEPYSDAYLSGMPSRKRRCERQSRPPHTLETFINESVREASSRPAPVDSEAVRRAFREHMRTMARSRASSSEDYDPLRYASAARFLNSADTNKDPSKKSEDKS